MQHPLFTARYLKEYFFVGLLAAILYMIPALFFLHSKNYQNLYFLFIGCFLFMPVIFFYTYNLINRNYEGKRAASMLIAGHVATLTGVVLSVILVSTCIWFFYPNNDAAVAGQKVIASAPDSLNLMHPTGLLLMLLTTCVIGNFGVGSIVCILVSYAAKRDQRKDKPVPLT